MDAAQNYCSHCHVFLDDEAAREIIRAQLRERARLLQEALDLLRRDGDPD